MLRFGALKYQFPPESSTATTTIQQDVTPDSATTVHRLCLVAIDILLGVNAEESRAVGVS